MNEKWAFFAWTWARVFNTDMSPVDTIFVSANIYLRSPGCLIMDSENWILNRPKSRSHRNKDTVTCLLQIIGLSILLSETEYNSSYQIQYKGIF